MGFFGLVREDDIVTSLSYLVEDIYSLDFASNLVEPDFVIESANGRRTKFFQNTTLLEIMINSRLGNNTDAEVHISKAIVDSVAEAIILYYDCCREEDDREVFSCVIKNVQSLLSELDGCVESGFADILFEQIAFWFAYCRHEKLPGTTKFCDTVIKGALNRTNAYS